MMMENARYTAVKLLLRTFEEGSFSNLLLDSALAASDMSAQDKRLCAMLYYGVTERLLTLEHIVRTYSTRPPEKLDAPVRFILYTGLYQLKYCEKIPDRAAVNETVALAGAFRKKSAAGLINAILRQFLRDGKEIRLPDGKLLAAQIEYSAPAALIQRVTEERGEEIAAAFFADALKPPPLTVRRNPLRADADALAALHPKPCGALENAYILENTDAVHSEEFRRGLFHVQDYAPQMCCQVLGARPGETVLDVCAAPGGKSFTLAEDMRNEGAVYAFDLHPKRVRLIQEGAERLGLSIIHAAVQDAKMFREDMPQADRILCDVPCSGLGVIRRKPEIKYKPLADFAGLPDIQLAILENSAHYLKRGGTLVYSTCTVLRAENEEIAERFLAAHPAFTPEPLTELGISEGWHTFTAAEADCDGFFIARFRKEE